MKTEEIMKIINLLDYLDGRGIVFEDEELVREALAKVKIIDGYND